MIIILFRACFVAVQLNVKHKLKQIQIATHNGFRYDFGDDYNGGLDGKW